MTALPATLLALTIPIAMLAGGCGDDNQDPASAPVFLSWPEFVKQGNAACRQERAGLRQRERAFERQLKGRRPEAFADTVHFVLLPTIEKEILRLEELHVRPRDKDRLEDMLDAQRATIDRVATQPRVPSVEAAERHFSKAGEIYQRYGLSFCAHGQNLPSSSGSSATSTPTATLNLPRT